MSRYPAVRINDDGSETQMVYGFDHALGYFYQEWQDDEAVVDVDSEFDGLTGVKLAIRLCGGEAGFEKCVETGEYPVPREHINSMMLDLTF